MPVKSPWSPPSPSPSTFLIIISSSTQRICFSNKVLVISRTSEPSFWVCHDFLLSYSLLLPSSASFLGVSCPPLPAQSFFQSNVCVRPILPLCSEPPFVLFPPCHLLNPPSNSFTPSLSSQVLEGVVESRSEVVGNLTGRRVTLVEGNPSRTAGHSSQQSREAPTAPRKRYTAKIELLPSNQRSKYISPSRRGKALWLEKNVKHQSHSHRWRRTFWLSAGMKGSKRKGWGSVLLLTPHLPATMPTTINLCFPCFFWKDLENTEIKNLSSMLLFTSATFHPSTRCPPLLTSAHPAACTDMILSTHPGRLTLDSPLPAFLQSQNQDESK